MTEPKISASKLIAFSRENQESYRPLLSKYLAEKDGKNLEPFTLLWYDPCENNNQQIQHELRHSINYMKIFQDRKECKAYIEQTTTEKIILIISSNRDYEFLRYIHDQIQVVAIYIYSKDNEVYKQYPKIKAILTNPTDLVKKIDIDQKKRQEVEDSIGSIGSFYNPEGPSTKALENENGDFMWFQLFIESLLRMSKEALRPSRHEFIEFIRQQYRDDAAKLRTVDDLESNYQANQAIRWYTGGSFLHSILNKAFRQQDYVFLFTLRFFIHDLFYSLVERKQFDQTIITLYRGQAMNAEELNNLIKNQGNFISMNSFLSTSRDRSVARFYAETNAISNNVKCRPVVFEIEVNTTRADIKPFADVRWDSQFSDEDEVLFMAGSIFRIVTVQNDFEDDRFWLIKLVLCGEEDNQLKELFKYLKAQLDDETDMGSVGKVLLDMGKNEQSGIAFEIDRQHTIVRTNGEFGRPLEGYTPGMYYPEILQEAQELAEKLSATNDDRRLLAGYYNVIGSIYKDYQQYDNALENYSKGLDVLLKFYHQDDLEIAMFHEFISQTYEKQDKIQLAIDSSKECLRIRQKLLPESHPTIAETFHNLGELYNAMDDFDKALDMYEKALKMKLLSSSLNHPSTATTHQSIGWVYEQINEFLLALKNYTAAFEILRVPCPSNDESLLQLQENIDNMKRAIAASSDSHSG
ncbi:unnamed protein product [Rotaria socialis]|uniref:NAD(P)(+)--arginine ADP-ribosyltransferase n=3 Tax=Rotaria socialis TaxID=392032 RepID=A0A820XVZ6_9BILA|nr:unnamed protein product [Rotaria socialis]CAF4648262.1 unnamed protein product [Rotaria socialis]CAF4857149.1 unnamed protein product [Rotaria socialis]